MEPAPTGKPSRLDGPSAIRERLASAFGIVPVRALASELETAERALCRLEGAVSALPDDRPYVAMHLRCEAVRSCALSGHSTPLTDLLTGSKSSARSRGSPPAGAAASCLHAMQSAMVAPGGGILSLGSVLDAYRVMCGHEAGPAGTEGDVQGQESGGLDGVRPGLRSLWRETVEAAEGESSLPALASIGLLQGRIECNRPFSKGNGRMARLLVPLSLERQRGLALGVSGFLLGHAAEYRRLARSVAESGDWDVWLQFFLRGLSESALRSADEIRHVAKLRQEHRHAITASLGHAVGRGLRVLDRLFRHPIASVADVQKITGTSYVAANLLVARFVRLGILEEVTGYRRNRVFLYGPYLKLFDAGLHELPPASGVSRARPGAAGAGRVDPATPSKRRPSGLPQEVAHELSPQRPSRGTTVRRTPDLSDHLL